MLLNILKRDPQERPKPLKRDLYHTKETNISQKRPTKETYITQKRAEHSTETHKIDLYHSKENYITQKRPTKETHTTQKRPMSFKQSAKHSKETHQRRQCH